MQYKLPLNVNDSLPGEPKRRRRARPVDENGNTARRLRIEKRNRILVARYYYWTEIRRRRFDDVMRILSESEFFVEERTISNALLDLDDYLKSLYEEKCASRDLKREYPNWNWETD